MITLNKINNEVVKPIPQVGNGEDKRPILGAALFPEIYANIFISASKNSGKTTVVYKITKKCVNKFTHVIVFASTLHKDKSYRALKKLCKTNNVEFTGYTSLKDDDGNDILSELVQRLRNEYPEDESEDDEDEPTEKRNIILIDESEDEDEKPRKSKYRSPDYLIILDDLSDELKSKSVIKLLKENRHYHMKLIISSQYLNDLLPDSRKQIDYFLVFRGLPPKKVEELYKDAGLPIRLDTFKKIYNDATKEKYHFMYIDKKEQLIRKDFDKQYNIIEEKPPERPKNNFGLLESFLEDVEKLSETYDVPLNLELFKKIYEESSKDY